MPNIARKDLLRRKGRIYVLDELAATKKFVELTVVDNIKFNAPLNPVEIKTPSGITIFKTTDIDASISFDMYHPGDNLAIERLFRGAVTINSYSGVATQAETVAVSFRNLGDCAVLPGFNGAKTAVTVSAVKKASDTSVTYTVTTDYTLAADTATGMTLITHVNGGTIPLNEDILVTYTYTPLKSTVLRPNLSGDIVERFLRIDSVDPSDATKYRSIFLPRATVTSSIEQAFLEMGKDNSTPNIMPVTMDLAKGDTYGNDPTWYIIDTIVV